MEIRDARPELALDHVPGRLTIDLGALADNWRTLAARAAPGQCAAVVKANAYGIGLAEAAPALWAAGARVFFVAHLSEGVAARRVLPGGGDLRAQRPRSQRGPGGLCRSTASRPSIGGEEELARWSAFAARRGMTSPSALHLDTGMNRLGFASLARLRAAMEADGAASGADLLMSHFVSSEIRGRSDQRRADRAVRGRARGISQPPRLARQFLRNVSFRSADLRPRPARLCALRRQSDARRLEPDAPGRDAHRRHPADPLDRGRRDLRLQRASGRRSAGRGLRPCSSATPTACRAAPARRMRSRAPRSRSPAAAARWSGACRWT